MKIATKQVPTEAKEKKASVDSAAGSEAFGARLYKILDGQSARTFALKAKITPAAFHKYLKCQSEPTRPVLNTIAEVAGVNLEWLSTGRGPMRKEDKPFPLDSQVIKIKNLKGQQTEFALSPELCHWPLLDLYSSADSSNFEEKIRAVFSAFPDWVGQRIGANPDRIAFLLLDDDSMVATIRPKEIVIIDQSMVKSPCDGVWAFSFEARVFIKRLQFMPGQKIKIKSDNSIYEAYSITPDDSFRLLGRAIATLQIKWL